MLNDLVKTIYIVYYLIPFLGTGAAETFENEEEMKSFVNEARAFTSSSVRILHINEVTLDLQDDCKIISNKRLTAEGEFK